MIVISMLLSGAVAGLIGMPVLFGEAHNYGTSFQTGLGFAGIAVALLGRNNPVGIFFGALIFAFLAEQGNLLNILAGVSPGHRRGHPGRHRARRGHRLRGRPPLPRRLEQSTVAEQVAAARPEEAQA